MNGRDGQPSFVHSLGARVLGLVSYVGGLVLLLRAVLGSSWQGALGRRASREAATYQMVRVGVRSVGIVSLVQLFIGVILALQMATPLEPLGQLDKISMIIGVAGGKSDIPNANGVFGSRPICRSTIMGSTNTSITGMMALWASR